MKFLKQHWLIIALVLVIFFTRLLIFNKDAVQFWADEGRYPILITNLEEASQSENYLLPIQRLFNIDARPGAGLFYYPAAFLEWINPNIPFSLYYNLIINNLILIIIFFIVKKIQNTNVAIVTTLVLPLSIASFIYIRHTLPYDIAILLLVLGVYFQVYFKKTFVFGLLASFSFLTYPSYYYYIIPIPFILFLYNRSIKSAIIFIFGILLVIFITQLISLQIGASTSYLRSLKDQSGGVTAISQGDYLPAIAYIGEYILAVDGYWNLFLILTIFPGILLIKERKKIIFFALYLIFVFLILEFFSHILHQHVLYGRTVRPLYLLSLGFAVVVLERAFNNFKNKKIYMICISILLLVSILNWLPRFQVYKNLTYPKQFQQKARDYLSSRYDKYEIEDALFVNYWNEDPPTADFFKPPRSNFFNPGEPGKFYTMNAIQTFPYYGNYNLDIFCKNEILIKEAHIQYIFKPYRFEGYKKKMRERMSQDPLYYQLIYCQR